MGPDDFFQTMSFSYGQGRYRRDHLVYHGEIVLGMHKLYLKNAQGEMADTFVPLEKIYRIRRRCFGKTLWISVRPSQFMQYDAEISGVPEHIRSLTRDLVDRRQLHQKGWRLEWIDPGLMDGL